MPRTALISLLLLAGARVLPASGVGPHLDQSVVIGACTTCHAGHGNGRSPMLPSAQNDVCLQCHRTRGGADEQIRSGALAAGANPRLLGAALSKVSVHPLTTDAFSARDSRAVVCTSCHSPHRAMPPERVSSGSQNRSPKDASRLEYELCTGCHGGPSGTAGRKEIARLIDPANRSYHPIAGPAMTRSPSVKSSLAGREINCIDCHGNDDPAGARGPHGSNIAPLLRQAYRRFDGETESAAAFALCYECHDRRALLESPAFPNHGDHIKEAKASCATCHDAHGSVLNRALIRFGDPASSQGVAPSLTTGRLAYVSDGPGSGACYLNCHGVEHGPKSYGSQQLSLQARQPSTILIGTSPRGREPGNGRGDRPHDDPDRRKP